jgi:dihydropteroate synthase-like protein
MPEHILFLTGRLAEPSLRKVLASLQPAQFTYGVHVLGLQVAGLMTTDMIRRRLPSTEGAQRVLVPGRCRGALEPLAAHFGVPFERGPEELKDLPQFFGRGGATAPDLSHYDVRIFAEIVDAPDMSVETILAQARRYAEAGADVIDLGCLPQTPFAHLEDAVTAVRESGYRVSVDSMNSDELLRGGRAGCDYLLSLKRETLWLANEVAATPVLIPAEHADMASLYEAIEILSKQDRAFIADPILDPIHFGFTESLVRYRDLRRAFPHLQIMMGTGNLTELTDADTIGMQAVLAGIMSELSITHLLTTQVSGHAQGVVQEADAARRLMYAARTAETLPRGLNGGLLALRDARPFPYSAEEIAATAQSVKDPSFRVQVSEEGIHVYNRDGVHTANEPFRFYPQLGLEGDASHAFYLGVELARAQIAWQLGKRYAQDEELRWGRAALRRSEPAIAHRDPTEQERVLLARAAESDR